MGPAPFGAGPRRGPRRGCANAYNLIWSIVSASEVRKWLIDGAIPVEARKKPNKMATTAAPALMDPLRIITISTIANNTTTDREMATTDHILARKPRRSGAHVDFRPPPTPTLHSPTLPIVPSS